MTNRLSRIRQTRARSRRLLLRQGQFPGANTSPLHRAFEHVEPVERSEVAAEFEPLLDEAKRMRDRVAHPGDLRVELRELSAEINVSPNRVNRALEVRARRQSFRP